MRRTGGQQRHTRAQRVVVGLGIAAAVVFTAARARADLGPDEKRMLAEEALKWAMDGGIADVKLIKDSENIVVVNSDLPPKIELHVPGRKLTLLSALGIQARADIHGDFLFFRLGPFVGDDKQAHVPIGLFWAVSLNSTMQYLSGGGTVLDFEKRDGKWQLLPVTNKWMS